MDNKKKEYIKTVEAKPGRCVSANGLICIYRHDNDPDTCKKQKGTGNCCDPEMIVFIYTDSKEEKKTFTFIDKENAMDIKDELKEFLTDVELGNPAVADAPTIEFLLLKLGQLKNEIDRINETKG